VRCPDGEVLAAWVDDEVAGPDAAAVALHIARCARCQRAEIAQRQVKRRTSRLASQPDGPAPDAALMTMLLTLPQTEHDRAVRRAHKTRCGQVADGPSRLRLAVVGAGALVWLAAAVTWSAPTTTSPAPASPPAGTPFSTATDTGSSADNPADSGILVARWGSPGSGRTVQPAEQAAR